MIPFDPGNPDVPSGIRFGTSSVAERGFGPPEMAEIGMLIDAALRAADEPKRLAAIAETVVALAWRFPGYPVRQ